MRPYGPNPEKPWRTLAMTLLSLAIVAAWFWLALHS